MSQATETRDATAIPNEVLTVEQFLLLPEIKPALEFIGGRIVQKVSPKQTHSALQIEIAGCIRDFVKPRRLGRYYTELRCTFGGVSLVPDVCFFAKGRMPRDDKGRIPEDITIAPDLVIEIHSPKSQTVRELERKIKEFMAAGTRLAWLVQPATRKVQVFKPGQAPRILGPGDTISGEDVLPGFELSISEVFEWAEEDS